MKGWHLLATVVALVLIGAAMVIGISSTRGFDSTNTPLATTILGIISTTIVAVFTLFSVGRVKDKVEEQTHKLENGLVEEKVQNVLNRNGIGNVDNGNGDTRIGI